MTVTNPAAAAELCDLTSVFDGGTEPGRGLGRRHAVYYAVKPLLPRRVQLAVRRVYARLQERHAGLAWPIEPLILEGQRAVLEEQLLRRGTATVPVIGFWPDRKRFAYVLTHDVEGPAGLQAIEPMLELEQRYGVRSAWYLVADDYPVPSSVRDRLRAANCEVGLHGLRHDGSLFRDRASFVAALPRIHEVMRDWSAVGFRSPSTHRNAAWMPELGCLYDSSFPDIDPFEPQPGGCLSILPFYLDDLVELPITLPQDHTLFEILRRPAAPVWTAKANWIAEHYGLVNVLVHPDYTSTPERLAAYEGLLRHLTSRDDGWHALPSEVAAWWRVRAALQRREQSPSVDPETTGWRARASVAYARMESHEIVIDL